MEEHIAQWYQKTFDTEIVPFLRREEKEGGHVIVKGIEPVKDVRILLSFPTSGGEAVEPLTVDGGPNPRAGEAKRKSQYLPHVDVEETDGAEPIVAADATEDAIKAPLTKKGKLANMGQPLLLITPARHRSWNGSQFGTDDKAEVAERCATMIRSAIEMYLIENPPDDAISTKTGRLKMYGKGSHFERLAASYGFMGNKGQTVTEDTKAFLLKLAESAPDGAAINLTPPVKAESDQKSIILQDNKGNLFAVSVRAKQSEKQKKEGKPSAYAALKAAEWVRFYSEKDPETGEQVIDPRILEAEAKKRTAEA